MALNNVGDTVDKWWRELPERFPNIEMDEFVVMPNHMHGIIHVVGAPLVGARNGYMGIHNNNRAGTRPVPLH